MKSQKLQSYDQRKKKAEADLKKVVRQKEKILAAKETSIN